MSKISLHVDEGLIQVLYCRPLKQDQMAYDIALTILFTCFIVYNEGYAYAEEN